MKKKKYIAPTATAIELEPLQMLAASVGVSDSTIKSDDDLGGNEFHRSAGMDSPWSVFDEENEE